MSEIIPYEQIHPIAQAMVKSGLFADVKDESAAIVKILAGREIGLGPFAAMSGIHLVKGKPVLGANLIATLIKQDRRYDYRILSLDDEGCEIEFYEAGRSVGKSAFTKKDAAAAGLAGDNWKKFPRNMYFARAISNGAKWYTAGVFGGAPIYSPEEFDMTVDEDGDPVIIEAATREAMLRPEPVNGNGTGYAPEPAGTVTTLPPNWLIEEGIVDNYKHAANLYKLLELADLDEGDQRDRIGLYRAWRDYGLDTKPAAAFAIDGKLPDEAPEDEAEAA